MGPLERLQLVKARMDKLKQAEDATVAFAVLDVLGRANGSLEQIALEEFTRKATLVTTNVPGPPEPASFGGHRLRSLLAWAPTARASAKWVTGIAGRARGILDLADAFGPSEGDA